MIETDDGYVQISLLLDLARFLLRRLGAGAVSWVVFNCHHAIEHESQTAFIYWSEMLRALGAVR